MSWKSILFNEESPAPTTESVPKTVVSSEPVPQIVKITVPQPVISETPVVNEITPSPIYDDLKNNVIGSGAYKTIVDAFCSLQEIINDSSTRMAAAITTSRLPIATVVQDVAEASTRLEKEIAEFNAYKNAELSKLSKEMESTISEIDAKAKANEEQIQQLIEENKALSEQSSRTRIDFGKAEQQLQTLSAQFKAAVSMVSNELNTNTSLIQRSNK